MRRFTYAIALTSDRLHEWQIACVQTLGESGLAQLRYVITPAGTIDRIADLPDCEYGGIEQVRGQKLDFILSFGDRAFAYELCGLAPHGVWRFEHGDLSWFSSAIPGFWETYYDHDVTGAALLKVNAPDEAGIVLKSGFFPTIHYSAAENARAVLDAIKSWPALVCSDIANGVASYFDEAPIAWPKRCFGEPNRWQRLALRIIETWNLYRTSLHSMFRTMDWAIARINYPPGYFIGRDVRANVEVLNPYYKGRFLADPFVVHRDSKTYIFCEDYLYRQARGAVAVAELESIGTSGPITAIEEPFHLSYPQIFEHEGETYCIPESVAAGEVRLYRAIDFPHRWEFVRTLIKTAGGDSTVVKYNGKWWLFCTGRFRTGYNSHLYIWHADDLFGTWKEHRRNPVKIDPRSSRGAGSMFVHEGQLYRPTQDCSRTYGGAIRINRIDDLSETDFRETIVGTIRPPARRYTKGIHTITAVDGCCIVDVKRFVFNPKGVPVFLYLVLKGAARRLGISERTIQSTKRQLTAVRNPLGRLTRYVTAWGRSKARS